MEGPTQPSSTQGRSFVSAAQRPLRIFVEPSEVPNRTKLIRTLKTSGASTCGDVAEADIIVVTPETASSQELIEGWSEKVFLDANWVYESIRRGRAYLEDENWGGFILNAGSGASGSNATMHKSPLPTPRETPSEPQPPPDVVMQQQQAPLPDPLQLVQTGTPVPVPQFSQQQQVLQQIPGGQFIPMQGLTQNYPIMVPAAVLAQLMGIAQQQGMLPGMGMAQMLQTPISMLPTGQPIPPGYIPQAIPFLPQPGMLPQGGFPMSQQPSTFLSQMTNTPFPQPMDVVLPVPINSYHNSSSPDTQRHSSLTASYRGSPMEQDQRHGTPESEWRHPGSSSSRAPGSRGAKRPREDNRETSGGLGLFTKRPGEPYLFFVQVEIRNRAKIADPIKKHGGKLVPDINQADFVILGHPATRNFEEWLRQSGHYDKLPLKPQWVFDCLEEDSIVDVEDYVYERFQVERKRGRPGKTGQRYILTAVKSGSEDGEEGEGESEHDEHGNHGPTKKKRKVERPVKEVRVKAENQKAKVERKDKQKEREKGEKGGKKKATIKAVHGEDATKSNGKGTTSAKDKGKAPVRVMKKTEQIVSRGPLSPPPPTIVVEHSTGKHLYTKEDYDYCDEYIPILLARDYDISNSAIAEKLHTKMPHHSVASWMTQLSSTSRREKLSQLRRRAQIQSRKVAAQSDGQPSTSGTASQGRHASVQSPGRQSIASTSVAGSSDTSNSVAMDPFKTMAEFFANGRADNLEDAAVWRVMSQEHPQLDAQQWEDYWSEHSKTVAAEVARLTGLQSSEVDAEGPKTEPE